MAEQFECGECDRSFDTRRALSSHEFQAHEKEDGRSFDFSLSVNQALILVFILGIGIGFAGGVLAPLKPSQGGKDTGSKDGSVEMSKINLEGEPVLGSPDAPVTMVIYEDFECPFCKRFETRTFPEIKKNYVDTGNVKVVWKDLPLPERIHPWADEAAEAMECVYRQDEETFWKLKDRVFENQDSITRQNVYSTIKSWAGQEGLSESEIQGCIDSGAAMNEVKQDRREASSVGASGTPTAIIDGTKIVGAQPYSRFKTVIDSKLS